MAKGQKKSIEEKIQDKETLIKALQTRIKSEQNELEDLYREKREKELEGLDRILKDTGLTSEDAMNILRSYVANNTDIVA